MLALFEARKLLLLGPEPLLALTSKELLLADSLDDADSLHVVGEWVELLDSDRCGLRDSLASGCMAVVEALGVVPAQTQFLGRTEECTVAGWVPLAPNFQDMVEGIQPCPFRL